MISELGRIVAQGTPEDVATESYTGQCLRELLLALDGVAGAGEFLEPHERVYAVTASEG